MKMKTKTNLSAKAFFMLFGLLVSSMLAPQECVDCQRFFPDEAQDFLGISRLSLKRSPFSCISILTALPSTVKPPWSSWLHLEAFFPESVDAQNALATLMRC